MLIDGPRLRPEIVTSTKLEKERNPHDLLRYF